MAGKEFTNGGSVYAPMLDNVKEGARGNVVMGGCAVSQRGAGANMSVDVASGIVTISGVFANVSAVNKVVTAADATYDRYDIISVNSSGTVNYAAGTAQSDPYPPDLPVTEILLAVIFVEHGISSITNSVITDERIISTNLGQVPIGGFVPWLKTFHAKDSGTTTSTSSNHLVESGQNFLSTVNIGNVVFNTTDNTFAYVTAVNSNTDLTLDADIMTSGEAYGIYATPKLALNWCEMDGTAISDSYSAHYNGATLPNLNGSGATTQRFIRGGMSSGATGGEDTHVLTVSEMPAHSHSYTHYASDSLGPIGQYIRGINSTQYSNAGQNSSSQGSGAAHNTLPSYYTAVWILRKW